jgi:hypothetical protein
MVLRAPSKTKTKTKTKMAVCRRDLFDRRVIGGMKLIYIKGIYIYIFFAVLFLGMYSLLVMILTRTFFLIEDEYSTSLFETIVSI